MRKIGAFRSLKIDCTKLRHRRMSWVVSKGRASDFSKSWKLCQVTRTLTLQKNKKTRISQISPFFDFESGLYETERLRNLKKSVKSPNHYLSMTNSRLNNLINIILWPFTDISLVQSVLKAKKSWNFWNLGFWIFWIVRNTWLNRSSSFTLWHPTF